MAKYVESGLCAPKPPFCYPLSLDIVAQAPLSAYCRSNYQADVLNEHSSVPRLNAA